jgi:hypothetical protein
MQALIQQWSSDSLAYYKQAKELLATGDLTEAAKAIALGEEAFLHADQLRLATTPAAVVQLDPFDL